MKLKDLFEAEKIPAVRDLPPIDPQELDAAITKLEDSELYQRLTKYSFHQVTTPIMRKNGTLAFHAKNGNGIYYIYANGQIRTKNGDRLGKLKSPIPVKDLYTRYFNALNEISSKLSDRDFKSTRTPEFNGKEITTLTIFEIPKDPETLTIENTNIENLEGCPTSVKRRLVIKKNSKLTSLIGCAKEVGALAIFECPKLTSLEGFPEIINGNVWLNDIGITSFTNIHKIIKKVNGVFRINNELKSNVLGLLKIDGITSISPNSMASIDIATVADILNRHLETKDILACQEALIEAGLKEYAKL